MEYVDGDELFDKILAQPNKIFSEKQAAEYMKQIISALNHCHANGVIHRDIKPENIMLTKANNVRLIDFGLSKICHGTFFNTQVMGTPYYMAPEMLDKSYNEKADMWSVGVLLYTLVSGYLPF